MTDRSEIEKLLRGLYDARLRGDLDAVCSALTDDADFRIVGAGNAGPIAIAATGKSEFRSWLALMLKSFRFDELKILGLIVEGENAAGHWQARIYSRVTGAKILTELVDLVRIRDGRICSYTEFFAPRDDSSSCE
jgi:ketosteroid isomerase-like protein